MTHCRAAFAIPGDIATLTGGYIYERRLLEGLRDQGHPVAHVALGASFPDPTAADLADAAQQLVALPPGEPLILDGLVFGSINTDILAQVRAPIVAMIHHPLAQESGLPPARRDHLFQTERANLAHAVHVLVPSPHTARLLVSAYGVSPERITIARPGTDRPKVTGQPDAGPPLILSVGILHPRKGHDILLQALARLTHRNWRAVIVGAAWDVSHADELAALHARLGLGDRVHLAGNVSGDALAGLYARATLFALATRYEGYGIVLDEAQACGLPIVSCRTGAVPDTVPDGAGVLVPPDDVAAFAKALDRVLTDTDFRASMARASARSGATLPGWADTARVASAVLDRLAR